MALCAALAALIALTLGCCTLPCPSWASQDKHAIPSISKAVSAGNAYLDRVEAAAGSRVRYRIRLTLPEGVERLERLAYHVSDSPPAGIEPDEDAVQAWVVDTDGNRTARMAVTAARSRKTLELSLGDVLAQEARLRYGDCILLEYPAQIAPDAQAGDYRNVALLRYDDGTGERETVGVMADVTVPEDPGRTATRGSPAPRKGGLFDATGNLFGDWTWLVPACLALASALVAAFGTRNPRRTDLAGWRGTPSEPDRR